ncbi:uncharacterized protein TRIADDRAFT_56057 [Trichoplax adhaerens]|uniref:G-protein coupled receptors family 1 profile domain-containing protein n=1 Tax=Trichoplax adhaerens TaxID=10228 RepID=B3RTV1_TRIAD|nr:hypothetical protein TRIADDRAFT_56057 [Trichoplax adhaerens]EDV26200.1 hypothetical protein TRIADDRAFT_56057 [Trichoplax adhaerens]|eukprot:XP_002112233.1 hypothetical protein TRIADDRAFT_56057 [Trichoplax adhaerens]
MSANISSTFRILQIAQRFFVVPSLTALILNGAILHTITKSKNLSKLPTYHLIANMVGSDLATGITFSILPFVSSFPLPFVMADIICRALSYIIGMSYMASILTLVAISLDRYLSILKPLLLASRQKKLIVFKRLIVAIWIISITASLPLIYVTGTIPGSTNSCAVLQRDHFNFIYFITVTVLLYVAPLVTMSVLYNKIYCFLVAKAKICKAESSDPSKQTAVASSFLTNDKRKALVKTLIIITTVFAAMTWPFFAMASGMAVTGIDIRDLERKSLFLFLLCAVAASSTVMTSVVNPILLIRFDKNIGARITRLYGQIKRGMNISNESSSNLPTAASKETPA